MHFSGNFSFEDNSKTLSILQGGTRDGPSILSTLNQECTQNRSAAKATGLKKAALQVAGTQRLLKAIEKDAVDRGLNAESVVAAYKKLQDDEKKAEKAERERSGKMLGEHPKIASHVFSRCFGSIPCVLDSAQRVVSCFPRNAQVFAILGDNTQSAERCESS